MGTKIESKLEVVIADRFHPSPLSIQHSAHESPVPLPALRFLAPKTSPGIPVQPPQQQQKKPLAEISNNIVTSLPPSSKTDGYSILSAVKANPRRRRSKKIFEQGRGDGPVAVEAQASDAKRRQSPAAAAKSTSPSKPRGRSKSMGNPMDITALLSSEPSSPVKGRPNSGRQAKDASSGTDRVAEQLMHELQAFEQSSPQTSPIADMSSPHSTVLPSFRQHFADHLHPRWVNDAFRLHDPLCDQYGYPPPWPQEWSCTDQLEREAKEQVADQEIQHAVGLRR